jgi:sterol desaturase/sphingolipid hydroxylase (fatty acid hydroxylase superfamily)
MDLWPIAIALPVFFACIGLEAGVAWGLGRRTIRANDTLAGVSTGLLALVACLFTLGTAGSAYLVLYDSVRLSDLPSTHAGTWFAAFLLADLGYYGWHRFAHRVNLGWAAHVVHHQSEDFTLAGGLRRSALEPLFAWPFFLPMALLGIPPATALAAIAIVLAYQVVLRTELVPSLGPVGLVLNTPSHHRVHHGINPQYLDRNYGGVLIVWDRLFGTFQPEVEPAVYGTRVPLRSWNPVWANLWWFDRLARQAWHTPRWSDKLNVFLKPPSYVPPDVVRVMGRDRERSSTGPSAAHRYDANGPKGTLAYIGIHFAPVAMLSGWLFWGSGEATTRALLGPSILVLLAAVSWAGLLERRWWALIVEAIRLMGMCAVFVMLGSHPAEGAVAGLFFGGSAFWLVPSFWPYLPSFRGWLGPRRGR